MDASPVPCTYCGLPADAMDHVIPQAFRQCMGDVEEWQRNRRVADTVPACHECNSLAGSKVFGGVVEKRAWIHERLRTRYAKVLRCPDWSPAELDELSPSMRHHVEVGIANKRLIRRRLRWPHE